MSSPISAGSAGPEPRGPAPVPTPGSARSPASDPIPRRWLILFAVLVGALVGSGIVLVLVVSPPSYEPVPIPTVSRT